MQKRSLVTLRQLYALQYANSSGLIDNDLRERGRKFIKHGVARLLMYMLDNNSFGVTPESEPATWLTAFALKTLCQASLLTSVDHENLTDKGFDWLFGQLNTNKTLNERDWRLAKDSFEYRIMLSAEVLIALLECKKTDKDDHLTLQGALSTFLQENVKSIKEPMVLAKVTYALMLDDDKSDEYKDALKKLQSIKRKNKQGHLYWSNMVETDETPQTPFWYHKGAQASAIEATAYALIIYLNHEDPNADPNADDIADWLVGQRNDNGAFIGAMDSTVAIQALSAYSFKKHGVEVDLHCNVSSDRLKEFLHSFKFTEENATHPKSLNNVPVGQVLDVLTTGQGLGQMQVNVEYNIPIEKNKHCPFHIIPKTTNTKVPVPGNPDRSKFCSSSCEIGCQNDRITKQVIVSIRTIKIMQECKKRGPPFSESTMCKRVKSKQRSTVRKNKPTDVVLKRKHRNVHDNQAISKKSICINICLQKKKAGESGPTEVQIEMLTGYQPVAEDIVKINGMLDVKQAVYDNFTEVLRVQFTSISCKKKTCLTFRALTSESVSRLMPAIIQVKKIGTAASQCVVDYYPPVKEVSLQMFCSNFNNSNKGQCKCLSGLCSKCKPVTESDATLSTVKDLVCKSKIAYKLQFNNVTNVENWSEIDATVIALNRTGK
uniref:Alpha-macroglobulin receptor-binding domain-containing protein n=1 Tax=Arion vulgaris TaxID=1028688 RepID=A0A0B7ACT9_9EUPU